MAINIGVGSFSGTGIGVGVGGSGRIEADADTVLLTAKSSTFIDVSSSGLTITRTGSVLPEASLQNPFS